MPHPLTAVAEWSPIAPRLAMERYKPGGKERPASWKAPASLPPVLLYCYLRARFGPPNGFMMALRSPSSENLVHWHWAVEVQGHVLNIWGPSGAVEFIVHSPAPFAEEDREILLKSLLDDVPPRGKEIGAVRKTLEPWTLFINPYHRLDLAIADSLRELDEHARVQPPDPLPFPVTRAAAERYQPQLGKWVAAQNHLSRLGTSTRMMAPVLGEAFVNLVLFVLARPDVRKDKRLYDDLLRRAIDVRVRGLHLNCVGFQKPVDADSEPFKDYHSLMNARNDLLHGNVDPQLLHFEEIFFDGKIPIFRDNDSLAHRFLRGLTKHVEPDAARKDVATVEAFVEHVLGCLTPQTCADMKGLLKLPQLGVRKDTGAIGVLFSDVVVEGFAIQEDEGMTD